MNNHDLLLVVCREIEPLLSQLVLVGGCVTELLVSDPAAPKPRMTQDVDWIVNAVSLGDYYKLESQLRTFGFSQTQDNYGIICRWVKGALMLDVMPTDEKILGFTNRWYADAAKNAQQITIEELTIHHITAPFFVASKLEAFGSRGAGDYRMSHDLEDLIAVIDGRESIVDEISKAPIQVREFLAKKVKQLLSEDAFEEALPGHLPPDAAGQARFGLLVEKLVRISELG